MGWLGGVIAYFNNENAFLTDSTRAIAASSDRPDPISDSLAVL